MLLAHTVTLSAMPELAPSFFARFILETRDTLHNYVRKLVRSSDGVEDIVQEAFLRTFEKRHSVHAPRAFLFTTARNLAADEFRRERSMPIESTEKSANPEVADVQGSLEEFLLADESSRILKRAIERLPPQRQAILALRVFHGHSDKEISEILGLSRRTVEQHIAKGILGVKTYVRARYSGGRDV